MSGTRNPELLDMVAVLDVGANADVEVGDVGTVVEVFARDAVEVEFLDRAGKTRCIATLKIDDVLVLNRNRTPVG